MSERDRRFVVADQPLNRRTARAVAPQDDAASLDDAAPAVAARARAVRARNRLGPPLGEQMRADAPTQRVAPRTIGGAIVATTGALGLFLAWLQSSPAGGLAAAAALGAGLVLARPRATASATTPSAAIAPAAAAAFDEAVDRLAPELPPAAADALAEVKELVLRIARHPAAGGVDEHFRIEDRLYVNECLRRYVPDSLAAYFTVPAAQRTQAVQELLLAQLAHLRAGLEAREQALGRSAAEALLRQQRFLDAKAGDQRRL